ncbi:DUF4230 domain-containing protein [Kordia sp.]|uniref:DUF4230 domain-containing protein n=1 Tax=Kordia sp. TaxID=1965332 RepID=UPI003D2CF549
MNKKFLPLKKLLILLSIIFIFFISLYLVYFLTDRNAYDKGYKIGNEEGYQTGNEDGLEVGYRDGFQGTKSIIETALIGVPIMLADYELEKSVNYQQTVNKLSLAKSNPSIRVVISEFSDEFNSHILNRLVNNSEFTEQEKDTIFSKYERSKQLISDEIYNDYISRIDSIDIKKLNVKTKAENFGESLAKPICILLDLLTSIEKHKVAKALINAGINRKEREFGSSLDYEVTDVAVSLVSEQLCNLLLSKSIEFIYGAISDYANMINFTEAELIGSHKLEKVMNLVTAKSSLNFMFKKSFQRNYAPDPNYSVQVNSDVLAGIDLAKGYVVEFFPKEITESGLTEIVITFPKPEILSNHTSIVPKSLNGFWAKSLKEHEIKELTDIASSKSHSIAFNKGILQDARQGTEDALNTLYAPLFLNSLRDYKLKINFVDEITNQNNNIILKQ